jgi:hypothetical protein
MYTLKQILSEHERKEREKAARREQIQARRKKAR